MAQIIVGETYDGYLEVYDENRDPVDFSGGSCAWALKETSTSAYAVPASMPVSGSVGDGYASVSVADTITASIVPGWYREEFEITLAGGKVKKFQRNIEVVWRVIT